MSKGDEVRIVSESPSTSDEMTTAGLSELLEAVLMETRGDDNSESLRIVREVARSSQCSNGETTEAVKELVSAILQQRLGIKKPPQILLKRVVATLMDSPEAISRLARIWCEARANG